MLTIYFSRPISGRPLPEVFADYDQWTAELQAMGYRVLSPMTGKDWLRALGTPADRHGYDDPLCTSQAILRRDAWMVRRADVVFCDLVGAAAVSIGCCFELAWAQQAGVHSIVALDGGNVHDHSFVRTAADVIYSDPGEALQYLRCLIEAEDSGKRFWHRPPRIRHDNNPRQRPTA